MPDADATIRLDQGGVNARILAKEAKVDFRRVESASRKIATTLRSPEVKRLFARYFNTMQLNAYLVSVIARAKLPHTIVEKIEVTLKAQLEKAHKEVDAALDAAELLCNAHGITRIASYDTEALALDARVISAFGRRYLELLTKVDRLMPILETLAIDEVIEVSQLDLQKAMAKRCVRRVAGSARNFAGGLRQRMNQAGLSPSAQSATIAASNIAEATTPAIAAAGAPTVEELTPCDWTPTVAGHDGLGLPLP